MLRLTIVAMTDTPGAPLRAPGRHVLGVSAYYHDSAAALTRGSSIVAAASEERFTRVKGCPDLPERAIDYVLSAAGIAPTQLELVAFYESPYAKLDRLLSTQMLGSTRGLTAFTQSMRTWLPEKLWAVNHLRDLLGRKVRVVTGDHHLSHAASAFYPSPFRDAAVLTVDGVGEWTTTMIGHGNGAELSLLEHIEYPNSLGLLYSAFTLYCGFAINSGEYKLMGLAPYGRPRYAGAIREHLIHLNADGSFSMNPEYFAYMSHLYTYTSAFESLFEGPTRQPSDPLTQRHADIAASIQEVTGQAMLGLARRASEITGSRNLAMAGGVALNVTANGLLHRSGLFDRIWVQPAAGDAGGALGVALWAAHDLLGEPRNPAMGDSMQGAFLGPEPGTREQIANLLDSYGLASEELSDTQASDRVAATIAAGKIVAIARGRMEFGPRALGNRSILADARDPLMQQRLNLATKFREGFRPFAPMVLAEHSTDLFDSNAQDSPYMTMTFPVVESLRRTPAGQARDVYAQARQVRSTLPAITHVDYSARVQTVDRQRNLFTHDVLTKFHAITGCPAVVNTSFNVRGEPIVATAEEALECFLAADIDVLLLGNHLIVKSGQKPDALTPRRPSARRDD